jgi:hypothetical protein
VQGNRGRALELIEQAEQGAQRVDASSGAFTPTTTAMYRVGVR